MRIMLALAIAATVAVAVWWNLPMFADAGRAADMSMSPTERVMTAFADLNLPIAEAKPF